ncbi:MAG: GNAT family N-acetyltransferase [Pseudomonas sp.]
MKTKSRRLLYERIASHHASELYMVLCDQRVYAHIEDQEVPTQAQFVESVDRMVAGPPTHRASEVWLDFVVRSKQTKECIGRIEATVIESRAEIAYLFGHRHWGKGYARESVQWLEQLVVEKFVVNSFWATVNSENVRSIALLKRLGYAEASVEKWPAKIASYTKGDSVFCRVLE